MARLGYALVALALLWCLWWFAGATATERGIGWWLEERRADGWAVDYTLETGGFPTAFATRLTDIQIADPATGLAFTAPSLELNSAAWAPNALDVVFPGEQLWASPFEKLSVTSSTMVAGASLAPHPKLALRTSSLQAEGVRVLSDKGWQTGAESLSWTSMPSEAPHSHALEGSALGIVLAQSARRAFDPRGLLPGVISEARVKGTLTFDADWDLDALELRRPQPTRIQIEDLSAVWGGLELRLVGAFDIDAQGIPEGTLNVKAVNWKEMITLMQSNGTLSEDIGPFAMAALEALASASGRADTIDAPLTLAGGFLRFGPVPIGPAPRFVIR